MKRVIRCALIIPVMSLFLGESKEPGKEPNQPPQVLACRITQPVLLSGADRAADLTGYGLFKASLELIEAHMYLYIYCHILFCI